MQRLLQYPADKPLVHVDHSRRRVLVAPPKRQLATRGCVQNVSYDGDRIETECSVPLYGINGHKIGDVQMDAQIAADDDMEYELNVLSHAMETQGAQFALVRYTSDPVWRVVVEHAKRSQWVYEWVYHVPLLREYLKHERESNLFGIWLSRTNAGPSA